MSRRQYTSKEIRTLLLTQLLLFFISANVSYTDVRVSYHFINCANNMVSKLRSLALHCGYRYAEKSCPAVEIHWSSGTCVGLSRKWTSENRTFSQSNGYMVKTDVKDEFTFPFRIKKSFSYLMSLHGVFDIGCEIAIVFKPTTDWDNCYVGLSEYCSSKRNRAVNVSSITNTALQGQKRVLDINCQNADGYTPIMLATRDMHLFERYTNQMSRPYNPVEVVTELLSARADLHATDGDGKTCLHHASSSKAHIAQTVVSAIIAGGPDLEQKDKRCFAPLHCASLTGNADCISTLLDGGSEVNSRGFAGATALHITSYNNHEKATSVLLEHGANVTLTDDRGLTPLDFAKTRKMRKRLQEAWTEVTCSRSKTSLGPIRAQSREDVRSSLEELNKKKKGEVIFEGLPSNPFTDSGKKDSIANAKGLTRHSSLKENNGKDDNYVQPQLRDSVRKLGQVRGQPKPSPLPRTKSRSTERLPMISPDRMGSDRNLESPVMFARNTRARRSLEDRGQGHGRRVPLSTREGSNLGEDILDRLTPGPPSPTPSVHHRRTESDPNRGTPNLLDLAVSCDPYLPGQRRGRSYSVNSGNMNDVETNRYTPNYGDFIPVQRDVTAVGVQREPTLMSICSYRTDSRMSTNSNHPKIHNLGKSKTPVQTHYGTGSNKGITSSQAFITQRCVSNMDVKSEADFSPRSDDGSDIGRDQQLVVPELSRARTVYKEEFVLEESRPKDPLLQSSSGTDTLSSSNSSRLSASPRESPLSMKGRSLGSSDTNSGKPDTSSLVKRNQPANVGLTDNVNSRTSIRPKVGLNTANLTSASGQSSKVTRSNTGQGNSGKTENTVPKTAGVNNSKKSTPNIQPMGLKTSVSVTADKSSVTKGNEKIGVSKSGGTIVVQSDIPQGGNSEVETSNKVKTTNNSSKTSGEKTKSVVGSDADGAKASDKKPVDKSESKNIMQRENSVAKNKTTKQMQNVLKVVPTKLTENIVRTAPKTVKDTNQGTKTVSSKTAGQGSTNVNTGNQNVKNVSMQLSPSAQVVNRLASQSKQDANKAGNSGANGAKADIKSANSNTAAANNNANTDADSDKQGHCSNESKKFAAGEKQGSTLGQSVLARSAQKPAGQTRNVNFNVSNGDAVSAGGQRAVGNVRKTSTGYTPRFSPALNSKTSSLQSKDTSNSGKVVKNDTSVPSVVFESSKTDKCSAVIIIDSKANNQNTVKVGKSESQPENLTSLKRAESIIAKSYNLSSVQKQSKVSNSSSAPSDVVMTTNAYTSGTENSEQNARKHGVLSKSISDPLEKSGKISSASIVNKSVAQLPSVGTVTPEKCTSKSLQRSTSMSTFDEKKETKLLSSSDTKLNSSSERTKTRPASDGPAVTSVKGNSSAVSGTTKPLVEILPDGVPRVSKMSYVEPGSSFSTPVIVNPFEELEKKRETESKQKLDGRALTATDIGFVIDKPGIERSKTQVSVKSKGSKCAKKGASGKPSSAQSRASSARKRKAQNKEANKSDNENSRPKSGKSGKRVKSGKRKRKVPVNLAKENEKSDVALISGIGWQIATTCINKSEADAVIVSQIDSSESESECVEVVTKNESLHLNIPVDTGLHIPNAIETPSSSHSPRFKEVQPSFDKAFSDRLPRVEDDGYPPMNLDLTNSSRHGTSENRSGVIICQDMPGNFSDFLSQLGKDEAANYTGTSDSYCDDYNDDYDTDYVFADENGNLQNELRGGGKFCHLTPIPESPSLSNTLSTTQRVSVTQAVEAALQRFDQNVKEEDLNRLLGSTPRNDSGNSTKTRSSVARKGSGSYQGPLSQPGSGQTSRNDSGTVHGAVGSQPSSAQSKGYISRNNSGSVAGHVSGSQPSSAQSKAQSRNNSSVSRSANFSGSKTDRNNRSASKSLPSPKYNTGDFSGRQLSLKSGDTIRRSASKENLSKSKDFDSSKTLAESYEAKSKSVDQGSSNAETKDRIDNKIMDIKKLLEDKMTTTQKLLEEDSKRRKTVKNGGELKNSGSIGNEYKINMQQLTEENLKALESGRSEDEAKSTRSSRKERRFSETKNPSKDDDMNVEDAIDEILSNTFPSSRSTLKSKCNSVRSANSTLTEVDKNVIKQMVEDKKASPFHAQGSVRVSSSFDESVTLNKDNPELMKRFHAENFKMGQRVKAMVDAGAENSKVKAMIRADNEAKQIAKIMNSFRQMELYAGSNNKSSRKETPRKDGEHMFTSMSRFDHPGPHSSHGAMPPRPGSAGAVRHKPGKFTEIKVQSAIAGKRDRMESSVNVPTDLAEEFKRSPFVRVSNPQDQEFDDLVQAIQAGSPDSDDDHVSLANSDHERADSACTSLSSHSSFLEETIQWKKGNVLGKGAFGTVWCGLTSEGQLIAVKQIELNTANQEKAQKEYEKVQEEVELLKTLEHKNIVGYLGTSLEDSIVSIFMQFVPGGSIASILARFGALDEAVFRKYTRQILEGVEYLHENDVIHRDIKGGNVMLMPNGVIKLIDFGCAKRLCINLSMGQSQILKSMKGTPYWMAPEVVNETGHGKKSDIWSVGCTVFEMATRKPPWADMNPMAAIFAIGSNKPVPQLPENFSEEVRDFVNACLTKDQTKRLSATELLTSPFLRRRSKKNSSNC